MGTGYTRNDTANNIADGNVINASDLDGEFDAVQAAFNGTTGHSHDGTSGEGPQIDTAGLADNAVTTAKITNANVTLAKMAANSVDSDQYVDGSIDRVHLAADIVDGTKIADDVIDSEHYVAGSIDAEHLASNSVTSAKLDTNIQVAGTLGVTGETTLSTHLNMGDNDIIKLGDSADLQIYHVSADNTSRIVEGGSGNLIIQGTNLRLGNADFSKAYFAADDGGAATIYYNDAPKLATTSGGIDVTGTVTADGLTVDGLTTASKANDSKQLKLERTASSTGSSFLGSDSSAALHIFDSASTSVATFYQNQDVAFYDDTGTTQGLFWDASTQRLGLGTTSPATPIHTYSTSTAINRFEVGSTSDSGIRVMNTAGDYSIYTAGGSLRFADNSASEVMRFSGGNVGIGTSSPDAKLDIQGSTTASTIRLTDSGTSGHYHSIGHDGANGLSISADAGNVLAGTNITFDFDGVEAMRIDSSGRVNVNFTNANAGAKMFIGGSAARTSASATAAEGIVLVPSASLSTNGYTPYLTFTANASNPNRARAAIGAVSTNSTNALDLVFATRSAADASEITGNDEKVRIDSSGRVGIGTNSPSTILHAVDAGGSIRMQNSSGTAKYIQMRSDSSNSHIEHIGGPSDALRINNQASGTIEFLTAGSEAMRIASGGITTVGGTGGSARLNAVAQNWPENALGIYSANISGQTNFAGIAFFNQDTDATVGNVADIYTNPTGTLSLTSAANPAIQLKYGSAGISGGNAALTVDSSGNVGIGTSSPATKLHVEGSALFDVYSSGGGIYFREGFLNTDQPSITVTDHSGGGNKDGLLISGYDGISFRTGAAERMRIDANGHVTMPYQSAFQAVKTTTQSNFTTGSDVTVTLQVELFDQNNDFSSNTFTAPVTGRYLLSTRVRLEDVDTAADYYILKIVTSNRNWINIMNPDFTVDGDFHSQELTVLADMDAGDTAYVIINQSGGTAQTDVVGDSSYSYFCGFLAC